MTVKTKEKDKIYAKLKKEDLDFKIEIATQTLDRNIGFITSCDNKTSIVLASFGALLAIIFTNEGLNKVFNILKACIAIKTICNMFYLICFFGSIFLMGLGMFNLGSVLVAKISDGAVAKRDGQSCLFFVGIRKSGDCKTYSQRFYEMSKEDFLNDLIEQIYINADIASVKYTTYNIGLRRTIIGFILFIVLLLIGIYVY